MRYEYHCGSGHREKFSGAKLFFERFRTKKSFMSDKEVQLVCLLFLSCLNKLTSGAEVSRGSGAWLQLLRRHEATDFTASAKWRPTRCPVLVVEAVGGFEAVLEDLPMETKSRSPSRVRAVSRANTPGRSSAQPPSGAVVTGSSASAFSSPEVAGPLLYSADVNPQSVGQPAGIPATSSLQAPVVPQLDPGVAMTVIQAQSQQIADLVQLVKGLGELQAAALTSGGPRKRTNGVVCDTTKPSSTCPRFPCLRLTR